MNPINPMTYCHYCGNPLIDKTVEGRRRRYCLKCQRPIYQNPLPATCLIVVNDEEWILLVKRSVEPKSGHWCLPGGFIELDEMPEAAALRELSEETGLAGSIDSMLGLYTAVSSNHHSILLIGYLIKHFHGSPIAGDDAADVEWFFPLKLPAIPFEGHRYFVNQYLHASPDNIDRHDM